MADRLRQTFPPSLNYLKAFPVIRGLVDLTRFLRMDVVWSLSLLVRLLFQLA